MTCWKRPRLHGYIACEIPWSMWLSLGNHTNLEKYSTAFSADFPKLLHLALVDNGLNSIPDVSLIADTFVDLILTANRITSLRNIYNIRFPKLSHLGLHENRIITISVNKLEMPQLQELTLFDNLIKVIEPLGTILEGSKGPCSQLYVSLDGNPWHCDVSLAWLMDLSYLATAITQVLLVVLSSSASHRWCAARQNTYRGN